MDSSKYTSVNFTTIYVQKHNKVIKYTLYTAACPRDRRSATVFITRGVQSRHSRACTFAPLKTGGAGVLIEKNMHIYQQFTDVNFDGSRDRGSGAFFLKCVENTISTC